MFRRFQAFVLAFVFTFSGMSAAIGAPRHSTLPGLQASVTQGFVQAVSLPDLMVDSVKVRLSQQCRPSAPLFYVTARVTNNGAAIPQTTDTLVYAVEDSVDSWGNGISLPPLNTGLSETVTFPIYFLKAEPEAMAGTHKFMIRVRSKAIAESDTGNNQYGPVSVTIPRTLCRSSS